MKRLYTRATILLLLLAFASSANAQLLIAIANGNFSSPSTWKDGKVPLDTIRNTVTIPTGITVILDRNLAITTGQLTINGTLSGNRNITSTGGLFEMGSTGILQIDSFLINNTSQPVNLSNGFAPTNLTIADGSINPTGVNIQVQNIYIEPGSSQIRCNMTIKPNGNIYVRSTVGIPLFGGAAMTLNNNYNVIYQREAKTSGIELTGNGLRDVTVDVGMGNEMFITNGLNMANGTLTINDGDVNINGGKLEISNDGQIVFAGMGRLKSATGSELVINKPGKTLNSNIEFKTGANTIKNLTVNTAGEVTLAADLRVTNTVDLAGGKLNLLSNKLSLITGGKATNASPTSYIVADGGGALVADIAPNTSVTFPIGTAANYAPCIVTSKNNTPYNSFSASVIGDVKNGGGTGNSIAGTQPLVNTTWLFDHNPPNNIALDVELIWSAGMEVNNFDRSNCYMSQLAGATWDKPQASAANETNGMYSTKREGMTHLSALAIFDGQTVDVPAITKTEQISIYPNPATNVLNVDIIEQTDAIIYNTMGQLLIHQQLTENNKQVDIAKLSTGLYLIQLKTASGSKISLRFYK